jgi:hypothetical protein
LTNSTWTIFYSNDVQFPKKPESITKLQDNEEDLTIDNLYIFENNDDNYRDSDYYATDSSTSVNPESNTIETSNSIVNPESNTIETSSSINPIGNENEYRIENETKDTSSSDRFSPDLYYEIFAEQRQTRSTSRRDAMNSAEIQEIRNEIENEDNSSINEEKVY